MIDNLLLSHKKRYAYWLMVAVCLVIVGNTIPVSATDVPGPFYALEKRLVEDGFDQAHINSLFSNPDVSFEKSGVSAYFMHNEAKLNYKQFLRSKNIASARKYMSNHKDALESAQKNFGVDKEVITAIILVETRLGTYTGNKSVINTLSTLAAMTEEKPRQAIWESLPDNDRRMSRERFEKKADRKSNWAYRTKGFLILHGKRRPGPHRNKRVLRRCPGNFPVYAQ